MYSQLAAHRYPQARCATKAAKFQRQLAAMLADANNVQPPPDASDVHRGLLQAGDQLVAQVNRAVKRVRAGKLRCGRPINRKLYGNYEASPIDELMEELRSKGYLPSGD